VNEAKGTVTCTNLVSQHLPRVTMWKNIKSQLG